MGGERKSSDGSYHLTGSTFSFNYVVWDRIQYRVLAFTRPSVLETAFIIHVFARVIAVQSTVTASLNLESEIYIQKYGCGHCRNSFEVSYHITVMLRCLELCNQVKTGPRSHVFLGDSPVTGHDAPVLRLT